MKQETEEEVLRTVMELQEKHVSYISTQKPVHLRGARQNRNKRTSPWAQAVRRHVLAGEAIKDIYWIWEPGPWPKYLAAAIEYPDGSMDVTILK